MREDARNEDRGSVLVVASYYLGCSISDISLLFLWKIKNIRCSMKNIQYSIFNILGFKYSILNIPGFKYSILNILGFMSLNIQYSIWSKIIINILKLI
jgi:hypothetical protein